jgi:hypothetical protein
LQVTDNGGLQTTDDISITVNSSLIANISSSASAGGLVILDGSASVDQKATAAINIEKNILSLDNAGAGLLALTAAENTSFQLNITRNDFNAFDNEGYIVYAYNWSIDAPSAVSMPDNWWGALDAEVIEKLIYDQSKNYKLPVVDYQPFEEKDIPGAGSSLPYPPLADAGPDLITDADHSVTLDGSNSYDPDGVARYHWQQTEGAAVNLKNADQPVASFIAPAGGIDGVTLQFQLTVSTDDTFSHNDMVNVSVTPDENLSTVDAGGCFIHTVEAKDKNDLNGIALPTGIFLIFLMFVGWMCVPLRRHVFAAVIILLFAFIVTATPAQAGYFAVGGGAGGDADELNVTIETGAKDIHAKKLDFLFGIGIHFIPHSDNELPSPTISAPCPNDECTQMGTVRKGTEIGFLGKFGVEIGSSDFYVNAIGGFTAFTESKLSRSPATGRTYEESSDSKVEALYGGGISYFINSKWDFVIQVDYDNIRGATGTIGYHW